MRKEYGLDSTYEQPMARQTDEKEAAALLDEAAKRLDEAKHKSIEIINQAKREAVEIEAETASRVMQAKIRVEDEFEKSLSTRIAKILEQAALDARRQIRFALEEISSGGEQDHADGMHVVQSNAQPPDRQAVPKPSGAAIDETAPTTMGAAPLATNAERSGIVETSSDWIMGKTAIVIAPPVNPPHLLGVMRYLENTLKTKIIQTSGSWETGTLISISVDRPMTLEDMVKDMPEVAEARIIEDLNGSGVESAVKSLIAANPDPNLSRRISIVLKEHNG